MFANMPLSFGAHLELILELTLDSLELSFGAHLAQFGAQKSRVLSEIAAREARRAQNRCFLE